MDIQSLRQQADLSFDTAVAKRNALERARSRQLVAHNDHLFMADATTINLVHVLKQRHSVFFVLDVNDNPCEIKDAEAFLQLLVQRNQESLNQYHQLCERLKRRR